MLRIDRCKGYMSTDQRDTVQRSSHQPDILKSSNNLSKRTQNGKKSETFTKCVLGFISAIQFWLLNFVKKSKNRFILFRYIRVATYTYRKNLVRLFSTSYKWDTRFVHTYIHICGVSKYLSKLYTPT
jgi:hypothetical protein